MKHAKEAGANRNGCLAGNLEQMRRTRQRLSSAVSARLLIILAVGMGWRLHASEATVPGQWNIMVVPANQTAYSGQARELFDRHCASCHSKDGRAQTPVAKQRHVQDLSECSLRDDKIVQQILLGSHDKTVDFQMPPFSAKLSRAKVESLVPLVKAFRPASPASEDPARDIHAADRPRLVGIINFPGTKYAVLEKIPFSEHYCLLAESESHDGITLERIKPKAGSVRLRVRGLESAVTLRLVNPPASTNTRGFLRGLFGSFEDARYEVALERASTDLVLFLQARFTGRTLLRSPRLPNTSFSLNAAGTDQAQIALVLERALAGKGIAVVPDGNKFLLVVLTSEVPTVKPRSSEIRLQVSNDEKPTLFPGGAFINFPNTELNQVVKLYTDLTGRMPDRTQPLPSSRTVKFTTQTALSREECGYALATLVNFHGVELVPEGNGLAKIAPFSGDGK